VRYVAVPAVLLVCGYRVLSARRLRSGDAALAMAAAASVALTSLIRAAMLHLGAFSAAAPRSHLSPVPQWPHNAVLTWLDIRTLFGAIATPDTRLGSMGVALGLACLLAAAVGLGRVAWTWRTASRAEQSLCVAIILNVGVYLVSVMPQLRILGGPHEIIAVLPFGAVLAARACVPARIAGVPRAFPVVTATVLAAWLPLAVAANPPSVRPPQASLVAWLEAHKLTYGIAGYWDASVVTMQSGNTIRIRSVNIGGKKVLAASYETNALWYDPSRYDATFVLADRRGRYSVTAFERCFGRPAATHWVGHWFVLVYQTNLLRRIVPLLPGPKEPPH